MKILKTLREGKLDRWILVVVGVIVIMGGYFISEQNLSFSLILFVVGVALIAWTLKIFF